MEPECDGGHDGDVSDSDSAQGESARLETYIASVSDSIGFAVYIFQWPFKKAKEKG